MTDSEDCKCETPIDIRESGRLNLEVITNNGFDPPSWENFPQKLLLVFTEVTEAEASEDPEEDPLAEELADIAIRLTGMLWGLEPQWAYRQAKNKPVRWNFAPLEKLLRPIRDNLTRAAEHWRKERRNDAVISLEFALQATEHVTNHLGIDLVAEMEKKREKNAKRPKFHGKVRSDG